MPKKDSGKDDDSISATFIKINSRKSVTWSVVPYALFLVSLISFAVSEPAGRALHQAGLGLEPAGRPSKFTARPS